MHDLDADRTEKQNQKNIVDQKMKINPEGQRGVYYAVVRRSVNVGPYQGCCDTDNQRNGQIPDFFNNLFHFYTFVGLLLLINYTFCQVCIYSE